MAQWPWFMQSGGGNRFHHDQAMHSLPDRIDFMNQLHHAREERFHPERTKYMLSRVPNSVPNGCLLASCPGLIPLFPVPHINIRIRPCQEPVWPVLPKSKGTGAYIPNYNKGSYKNNGNAQRNPKIKPTKSITGLAEQKMKPTYTKSEKKEEKHAVSCQTLPEMLLPTEWTY